MRDEAVNALRHEAAQSLRSLAGLVSPTPAKALPARWPVSGLSKRAAGLQTALCSLQGPWLHPFDDGPGERLVRLLDERVVEPAFNDGPPARNTDGVRQPMVDVQTFFRVVCDGARYTGQIELAMSCAAGSLPAPCTGPVVNLLTDLSPHRWLLSDVVAWARKLYIPSRLRQARVPGNDHVGAAVRAWSGSVAPPAPGSVVDQLVRDNQVAARRHVVDMVLACLAGVGPTNINSAGLLELQVDAVLHHLGVDLKTSYTATRRDAPHMAVRAALLSLGFLPRVVQRTAHGRIKRLVLWQLDADAPPSADGRRWPTSHLSTFPANCNPRATGVQYRALRAPGASEGQRVQPPM